MKLMNWFLPGAESRIRADTDGLQGTEFQSAYATVLAGEIGAKCATEFDSLLKLIEDAQDRIAELKAEGKQMTLADSHRGGWLKGLDYKRGELTTCNGSMWLALGDTTERPGTCSDWRLIVKSGRDATNKRN